MSHHAGIKSEEKTPYLCLSCKVALRTASKFYFFPHKSGKFGFYILLYPMALVFKCQYLETEQPPQMLCKKSVLKSVQISLENTCIGVSF